MLNRHIKDCFKCNGKQNIVLPKIDKYAKFKNFERKIKSTFKNPNESYNNKY